MNKFCSTHQGYVQDSEGKTVRKRNSSGGITGKFMCFNCINARSKMKKSKS